MFLSFYSVSVSTVCMWLCTKHEIKQHPRKLPQIKVHRGLTSILRLKKYRNYAGWTFEHYTGDASSASQLLPSTSSFLSYFSFFCSFFHSYFSCFTSVTPPPFISSSTHIFLLLNLFILILLPSSPQLFSSSFLLFRGRPKPPSHHSALQRQIHPEATQAVIVIILIIMITPSPSSPSSPSLTLHSPATETSRHRSSCHRHHDIESSLSSSSILVRWWRSSSSSA